MFSLQDTLKTAIEVHHLREPGRKPDLVPIGLPFVDDILGGLGPASCGILAAATGVGKSSIMLRAMLDSKVKVGCVSVEDTKDLVGTRVLAAISKVDSLKIRRNDLSDGERAAVLAVEEQAEKYGHLFFQFPTSQPTPKILRKVEELAAEGCKLIWLDYIQEVRGHHVDRRNEVAMAMQLVHGAAADSGAALMAISQFHRMPEDKMPNIHNLAESGDLERKARLIILAHKVRRATGEEPERVHLRVGKSNYGGENAFAQYIRDPSGTLVLAPDYVSPVRAPAALRASESTEDW